MLPAAVCCSRSSSAITGSGTASLAAGSVHGLPAGRALAHDARPEERRPRNVTLNDLREGSAFVVIGSNAGDDRDPLWWRNLKANPDAEVRTGTKRFRVRPREAQATERELLWDKIVARDASYAEYERRTKRRIPVVLLEPTTG
ncbi:MAG TPA: nitroreductase family deazaflavin-dependent oxidoreductase [Chloroflexi bacterium]|nr:nitroreductase family deazaflavin-dependent oxidoreductase [Chloroflexota bacterium]HAL27483.1 nitroreductase family deazaflavin-dependent oxidoreductase [Chloroflexota bacterium]